MRNLRLGVGDWLAPGHTEENQLTYMPIFNKSIPLVEKRIAEQLLEQTPRFNMVAVTTTLQHHDDEVAGDTLDVLLTFMDSSGL